MFRRIAGQLGLWLKRRSFPPLGWLPLLAVMLLGLFELGGLGGTLLVAALGVLAALSIRVAARLSGTATPEAKTATVLSLATIAGGLALMVNAPDARDLATGCIGLAVLAVLGTVNHRQLWLLSGAALCAYTAWLWRDYLSTAGSFQTAEHAMRGLVLMVGLGLVLTVGERLRRLEIRVERRSGSLNRASFRLVRASQRDPLTESYNRGFLMEALEREKQRADREGQVFSICLLDLDHFKSVNDQFGHLAGDRVLREFVEHLRATLRSADWVSPGRTLGRYHGCEFMVILPATRLDTARRVAERLRRQCAQRRFSYGLELTLSVGIAEYRLDHPLEELLKQADRALHLAKQMGRDCVESGLAQDPDAPSKAQVISLDAHRRR